MAAILQDNNEFNKAIEYYTRGIASFEYHHGSKHQNIAVAQHNIALCYAHLKNYRAAAQYERRSFDFFNELHGEKDPRTTSAAALVKQFTEKAAESDKGLMIQQKSTVNTTTRATDDNIGSLPIRDIMKYINNNERSKVRSFRQK